jgi:hypothetical protein
MSPEAFELYEARNVQERVISSAVAAVQVTSVAVPEGKIHTIRFVNYAPDAAETRTVYAAIVSKQATIFAITRPVSIALSASIRFPVLEQGNELKLYPGEYIIIYRDVATAGSVMNVWWSFIETDLPFYSYVEPLKKVAPSPRRHATIFRSAAGGGGGVGGAGGGGHDLPGGGGGGPEPV